MSCSGIHQFITVSAMCNNISGLTKLLTFCTAICLYTALNVWSVLMDVSQFHSIVVDGVYAKIILWSIHPLWLYLGLKRFIFKLCFIHFCSIRMYRYKMYGLNFQKQIIFLCENEINTLFWIFLTVASIPSI